MIDINKDLVPDYYQYLTWYDLDTIEGIYWFIQEMINDGIDLKGYPEIDVYYDILNKNIFRDEPNMMTVDYVILHLKRALIKYGFAHTTRKVKYKLYYYWYGR